jgi:hypothetical protein
VAVTKFLEGMKFAISSLTKAYTGPGTSDLWRRRWHYRLFYHSIGYELAHITMIPIHSICRPLRSPPMHCWGTDESTPAASGKFGGPSFTLQMRLPGIRQRKTLFTNSPKLLIMLPDAKCHPTKPKIACYTGMLPCTFASSLETIHQYQRLRSPTSPSIVLNFQANISGRSFQHPTEQETIEATVTSQSNGHRGSRAAVYATVAYPTITWFFKCGESCPKGRSRTRRYDI